jgi:hypothetical protein
MWVSQRSHVLYLPLDTSLCLCHMDDRFGDILHGNFLTCDCVGGHCRTSVDPGQRSRRFARRTFDLAKRPFRDILYDGVLTQL